VSFIIGNLLSWRNLALTGESSLFEFNSINKGTGGTEKVTVH